MTEVCSPQTPSNYIYYYILNLPFKTFQIIQKSELGIFLGKLELPFIPGKPVKPTKPIKPIKHNNDDDADDLLLILLILLLFCLFVC